MLNASRVMGGLLVLAVIAVLILASINVSACINPSDIGAVEVLFNKPGVNYNLTALLGSLRNVLTVEEGKLYAFKYIYATNDGKEYEYAVFVYIERFCNGAPCIENYNEEPPVTNVLGLRIEPLETRSQQYTSAKPATETPTPVLTTVTTVVVVHKDLITVVDNTPTMTPVYETITTTEVLPLVTQQPSTTETIREDVSLIYVALYNLLNALTNNGVITGLSRNDIATIAWTALKQYPYPIAGWNNRLMYSEALGNWAPYSTLVCDGLITGLVIKGNKCSYAMPKYIVEELKEAEASLVLTSTPTIPIPMETVIVTPTTIPSHTLTAVPVPTWTRLTSTLESSSSSEVVKRGATGTMESNALANNGFKTATAIAIGIAASVIVYIALRRISK